jgi:hypothetical protein
MLVVASVGGFGSVVSFLDYVLYDRLSALTIFLLLVIAILISLIAGNTKRANRFVFSCAFWVAVDFFFYILLKALFTVDDAAPALLHMSLTMSILFLSGYLMGQSLWTMPVAPKAKTAFNIKAKMDVGPIHLWLVLSFICFKLMNIILMTVVAGGKTALEISQSTQNQGAAYVFTIPEIAFFSYLLILLFAYKHGQYLKTAMILTAYVVVEAVITASRYSLVITCLINLFLYHLYIKNLNLIYLILFAPFGIFVVSFFGYVREVEIANLQVYFDAMITFMDEPELIFNLFLTRLDMLPNMIDALRLDIDGHLKFEGGLSYVYSVLHAVPRFIWPEKPLLTSAYVTEQVNPSVFAAGVNIYPSIMLEAYINFHWLGVFLIGLFIARLAVLYEKALMAGSLRTQAFALMAFSFPMGLLNEGIHSRVFASICYLFFLCALWLILLRALVGKRNFDRLGRP